MTPVEVRQKAAELIEERGWWQGDFVGCNGRSLCVMGALLIAAGVAIELREQDGGWIADTNWPKEVNTAMADVELELDLPSDSLSIWNDAPAQTQEEVIAALRGQQS